ncbi:MAG: hypothetical protein M3R24_38535 [Chloroflexota bacterium]|nr:hypothetical protein [Chloroflexota bacterium]
MTNWYILVTGLPRPEKVLHVGPGISLSPLTTPLTVFDLAAAGAAGFREWAILEPLAHLCTCELESAGDAAEAPGYDTLNRAWLTSALLVLRGFTTHLGIACSAYSWDIIAGHQARTSHIFQEQLIEEGVDAAVFKSKRDLARFEGGILDYHLQLLVNKSQRNDVVNDDDAVWIQNHFDTANRLANESASFRLALEATIDWRYAKEPLT